jgi:uncharacterized protein (DUF4415 family)
MSTIEIHIVDKDDKADSKDVLELIHSSLITCGIVEHPKINYGLTEKDPRKYVSIKLTQKVLDFLKSHGSNTEIAGRKTG